MKKAQTATTNAVTNVPKRSSIISKWAAPFAAKQRNPIDQDIRLDEPFRQYAPGDNIKGAVHVTVLKPLRITHLVLRLHGFVKVSNRAKVPGEKISYNESLSTSSSGSGRRGTEYFGNGFARIFEDEAILCGEGRLHGQYQFCFEMSLPSKGIPSSIDVSIQPLRSLVKPVLIPSLPVRTWDDSLFHQLDNNKTHDNNPGFCTAFQIACSGDYRYRMRQKARTNRDLDGGDS